jgi:hypothetical protein
MKMPSSSKAANDYRVFDLRCNSAMQGKLFGKINKY